MYFYYFYCTATVLTPNSFRCTLYILLGQVWDIERTPKLWSANVAQQSSLLYVETR